MEWRAVGKDPNYNSAEHLENKMTDYLQNGAAVLAVAAVAGVFLAIGTAGGSSLLTHIVGGSPLAPTAAGAFAAGAGIGSVGLSELAKKDQQKDINEEKKPPTEMETYVPSMRGRIFTSFVKETVETLGEKETLTEGDTRVLDAILTHKNFVRLAPDLQAQCRDLNK